MQCLRPDPITLLDKTRIDHCRGCAHLATSSRFSRREVAATASQPSSVSNVTIFWPIQPVLPPNTKKGPFARAVSPCKNHSRGPMDAQSSAQVGFETCLHSEAFQLPVASTSTADGARLTSASIAVLVGVAVAAAEAAAISGTNDERSSGFGGWHLDAALASCRPSPDFVAHVEDHLRYNHRSVVCMVPTIGCDDGF